MNILYTGLEASYSVDIIHQPHAFINALGINDDIKGQNNHFFKVRPLESNKIPISSEYNIIKYNGSNVPTIQLVLNECDVYFNEHDGSYDIFTNNWVESYLL